MWSGKPYAELWNTDYDESIAQSFGLKGGYSSTYDDYNPAKISYLVPTRIPGKLESFNFDGPDVVQVIDFFGQVLDSVKLGDENDEG